MSSVHVLICRQLEKTARSCSNMLKNCYRISSSSGQYLQNERLLGPLAGTSFLGWFCTGTACQFRCIVTEPLHHIPTAKSQSCHRYSADLNVPRTICRSRSNCLPRNWSHCVPQSDAQPQTHDSSFLKILLLSKVMTIFTNLTRPLFSPCSERIWFVHVAW